MSKEIRCTMKIFPHRNRNSMQNIRKSDRNVCKVIERRILIIWSAINDLRLYW